MFNKIWTQRIKNLAVTGCCAFALMGNFSAQASQEIRQELDQMLINLEDVYNQAQEMGYTAQDQELVNRFQAAKVALANVSDAQLTEYSNQSNNLEQVLLLDDMLLEIANGLSQHAVQPTTGQLTNSQKRSTALASAVPSTTLSEVDTENLELEGCANQVALTAVATPLRAAVLVAEGVVEVTPANIVSAGQSVPNPAKIVTILAKAVAKTFLLAADEAIRFNALCTLRNERKIQREYIQARQVRYTPLKSLEASFDVVRPINLGGNKKYRYTFWMHLSLDGQATTANVTKVMASQLDDANAPYVTLSGGQYTVTEAANGLYKLVFDTPTDQGLDYVRGFVIHLEKTKISPADVEYKHYGLAHIRSDANGGLF